ncbi:phage head closure protein [Listeria booriae]|uniref:phage head closure protein n=1 Tax=Listeria booriae TaxID=1552123 RepID=UPI001628D281|nr:phage head closure protein [Listeria booriae]MBC1247345.1 phage head closure protein [Listeria booriae]
MMQKVAHNSYNDGVLHYGRVTTIRTVSGRRQSEKKFVPVEKLFYEEMSIRQEDRFLCGTMENVLDIKVKTPFRQGAKTYQKVQINEQVYDVITIDADRHVRLFWYLQKVGDVRDQRAENKTSD